jgi:hypothetical protein
MDEVNVRNGTKGAVKPRKKDVQSTEKSLSTY